jgi:hypothetical protein
MREDSPGFERGEEQGTDKKAFAKPPARPLSGRRDGARLVW